MRVPLLVATVLLPLPALSAQSGPTIKVITGSDYSMVADNGTGEVIQGKPNNTTLTLPLELEAKSSPGAIARHRSELVTSSTLGKGLRIRESASGYSTSSTGSALAGTLDELGPRHTEPHTLIIAISNTAKPTGTVTIVWSAWKSSANASARTAIDLNGDLTPEFEAEASSASVRSFPVTVTAAGYFFKVETEGEVEVEGRGAGSYALDLSIYFREGGSSVSFTPYGTECSGKLAGSTSATQVKLDLTNATPNAYGVLALGSREVDWSLGTCKLLVAPWVLIPILTDGSGKASTSLPLWTGIPFSLRAQDVTVWGGTSSLKIGTSNGLEIVAN